MARMHKLNWHGLHTYYDAVRVWDDTDYWRDKDDRTKPWGWRRKRRTGRLMTQLDDGSIRFERDGVHVVTYHPDKTITVGGDAHAWGGYASQGLGSDGCRLLPRGAWVVTHPQSNRQAYVQFRSDPETKWSWRNGGHLCVRLDKPVKLRTIGNDAYECINLDEVEPWEVRRYDRRQTRQLSKDYHLADYKAWMQAMISLAPDAWELMCEEYEGGDPEKALHHLYHKQFDQALKFTPKVVPECYGRSAWRAELKITPCGSIEHLRKYLYAGSEIVTELKPTISAAQEARQWAKFR